MLKRKIAAATCSLMIASAMLFPQGGFAAPNADDNDKSNVGSNTAEVQGEQSARAEAPANEPADPELAALVKAAIEEDRRAGEIVSPRTEEEKEALREMLAVDRAEDKEAQQIVPSEYSGVAKLDESGVEEFLADETKTGIPQPASPEELQTTQTIAEDEVSAAIGKKGSEQTSQTIAAGNDFPPPEGRTTETWTSARPSEEVLAASVAEFAGKTVVSIDIEGVSDETAAFARQAILSRPGDVFTAATVEKDRDSIYNTGYFYDLYPTVAAVPEGVVITYHVMENPRLTKLEIIGNTVERDDVLRKMIEVEEGKVLNTKLLHENVQAIDAKYHEDGYILVKIGDLDINKDGVLKIVINEGKLEDYLVKGNKKTKDRVIIREMRQKPGEPFNAKMARRGMQRIYNLGYFEDVNMKLNPGVEPNAVVLEIDVVEKRSGNFTIGAGYSSQDGFIGMVGIGDMNFRGTGDSINFTFEFSGDDEDAHGWQLSYRKPWLDRHETAAVIRLYNRTYEYTDYDTHGDEIEEFMRKYGGGEITLSRPQSEYITNYVTLRHRKDTYVRHNDYTDRSGSGHAEWRKKNFGTTESITLDHVIDTRDNIYNPTSGSRQSISGEFAGAGGDFNYQKYTYDDQHYFKVGHAQVIAFHAAYGLGYGHISEFNQYRIGGQKTLRGYRDEQFRGDRTAYGSLEYRFPLVKKIDMAIFTDFGAAWDEDYWPKTWKQSIGVGISLNTPMGPVRLDYGYGSQGGRVHFSVGSTF